MIVNEYLDIMNTFIGDIPDSYYWLYQLFLIVFPVALAINLWRCIRE